MFFNDDVRVGDTSSPTTYEVSGTLDPNSGQYGWTKSDQGHFNQLVTYVNACREYYESSSAVAGYAKEAIKELVRIEGLIQYIHGESDKVERLAIEIKEDTDRAVLNNDSVTAMHTSIQLLLTEVRTKYDEIVKIGDLSTQNAESAKADATLAADYYLKTKAMYDEWKATKP